MDPKSEQFFINCTSFSPFFAIAFGEIEKSRKELKGNGINNEIGFWNKHCFGFWNKKLLYSDFGIFSFFGFCNKQLFYSDFGIKNFFLRILE